MLKLHQINICVEHDIIRVICSCGFSIDCKSLILAQLEASKHDIDAALAELRKIDKVPSYRHKGQTK
jgi:hypothetical protein